MYKMSSKFNYQSTKEYYRITKEDNFVNTNSEKVSWLKKSSLLVNLFKS